MSDPMLAETITIHSDQGDDIEAYLARPLGSGPYPSVVVIHHMPGYDAATKEIARRFAVHGYLTICPNLHQRYAPGADPADASAAARAAGGVPDSQCLADVGGAIRHLRALPESKSKVGVIGYCSGGRQTYLVACTLDIDAAVDCYGGNVVASAEDLSDAQPRAPIDLTPDLRCPLLGLFGAEDRNPSPDHVATMEKELQASGKSFELHSYEGAGHGFFAVDRPSYDVEAAKDGWQQIWSFFGNHLAG